MCGSRPHVGRPVEPSDSGAVLGAAPAGAAVSVYGAKVTFVSHLLTALMCFPVVFELSWENARHLFIQQPQQQLSPLTAGDARARQGVSEHQGMQKSLPPSAQGLSDPFQLSVSTMFLTALWETNHCRDSPSGLTWAGERFAQGWQTWPCMCAGDTVGSP